MTNGAPRELVIVGAGGFSRETAAAAQTLFARTGGPWRVAGFADDSDALCGSTIDGLPVLGGIDDAVARDADLVIGIGRPDAYTTRMRIVERLDLAPARYATIVHPACSFGDSVTVGEGTVALANVVATTAVQIGRHVALMPGIVLTHDDVIGDYATLGAGVRLGGSVRVGTGAYIGSGVTVREGVSIGAWAMVGMGSVVTRDVPSGELWLGSPAHFHRAAPVPVDVLERAS